MSWNSKSIHEFQLRMTDIRVWYAVCVCFPFLLFMHSVFLYTDCCFLFVFFLLPLELGDFFLFIFYPSFLFTCVLRVAFCFQVSEWKPCPAAWWGQSEHIIWIPTAAAQTLYWVYKKPACGQQGTVWCMLSWLNAHCHVACRWIDFRVVSHFSICLDDRPYIVGTCGLNFSRNVNFASRLLWRKSEECWCCCLFTYSFSLPFTVFESPLRFFGNLYLTL